MRKLYQDKEWLYEKYIIENLSCPKIAEINNVNAVTVRRYLKKYGITKPKNMIYRSRRTNKNVIEYVVVDCDECGNPTKKDVQYYKGRMKLNKDSFYCSEECVDKAHSVRMSGKGNPNYGGEWYAPCTSTWSEEKRKQATHKMIETVIKDGTFRGSNNGRWAGGMRNHNCVLCGKDTEVPPYVHRQILKGKRKPCCSNECASALGRRNVKYKATSIEIAMAEELSKRGIKYVEQYRIGNRYVSDFYLSDHNIIIECDGDYWHTLPEVITRDKRKNADIKARGYSLYRFWESEINESVEACVDIILAEINEKEAIA